MKKLISLLLAVLMLAALSTGAYADAGDGDGGSFDFDMPEVGLVIHIPSELLTSPAGHIDFNYGEELSYGSGAYYTEIGYYAMSEDEFSAQENFDETRYAPLVAFACVRNGCDLSAFADAGIIINWADSWRVGTIGNYTHYFISGGTGAGLPAGFVEPYASEYQSLLSSYQRLAGTTDYSEPVNPYAEQDGKVISFETTDLDGRPVSSTELFSANQVTMVNIWATWCGHCVGELPDLARIHNNLQGMGCGIVGILTDGQDPDDLAEAKQDVQDAGVGYPVVMMPKNGDELFDLHALPITYFVDSTGTLVGVPVSGAQVDAYEKAVQDILNGTVPG